MLQKTLGRTGLKVGVIGLGTWNIGGQWGDVDDATGIATVRAAYDSGMTLFDTADAYGEPVGRSEELMGKGLAGVRDQVIIATKVGNFARRQGHALTYTHPLHVELCCDASLKRMRIDVIDLYQCHLSELLEPQIFLESFETLKKKGKIRFGGISTNKVDVVKAFDVNGGCSIVQLDYSLLNRQPEAELLPYCQQHNIGVLVRGPLAQGVATGKFNAQSVFNDSVRKNWNDGQRHEKYLEQIKTINQLKVLENPQRSMTQAALQFVFSHPAVTCAIPGAKSPEQAKGNAAAGTVALSQNEMELVNQVTK